MKESFVLFTEQKEIINKLSDEQAGKIFKALFDYVSDNEISKDIKDDLATDIVLTTLKQTIDRNNEKWEETKQKRSEAGKRGAEKRWQNQEENSKAMAKNGKNGKAINEMAKMAVNVSVNDSVSVNGNVSVNDDVSVSNNVGAIKEETAAAFYIKNINPVASEFEIEQINDYEKELPSDLIIHAMQISIEQRKTSLKYIKGILKSWKSKGILCLKQAVEEEQERLKPPSQDDVFERFLANCKGDGKDDRG